MATGAVSPRTIWRARGGATPPASERDRERDARELHRDGARLRQEEDVAAELDDVEISGVVLAEGRDRSDLADVGRVVRSTRVVGQLGVLVAVERGGRRVVVAHR